ncbi:hypothetical protein [Streptomyces bicolor]|nr:hypothetical protein [Streptomyces bicolor]
MATPQPDEPRELGGFRLPRGLRAGGEGRVANGPAGCASPAV